MSWAGRRLARFEDAALLRGRGRFTADLPAARCVRFVRSPLAAGRIRAVEAPAGATVVTAADLGEVGTIRAVLKRAGFVATEQPLLAGERVRYAGEPVAAALAPTEAEAEDIAEAVVVDIEASDAVVDIEAALAEGAPAVHDAAPGNVVVEAETATGGAAAAFEAAHAVVEVTLRSHRQNATPLEARCAHAAPDAASGRITLTCATQNPHVMRTAIADVLRMPEAELRVVAPHVGGGFGQKMVLPPEYAVVVWLARRFGLSVRWVEDRRENLTASVHARDQALTVRGAFEADGRLSALAAEAAVNVGAYSSFPTTSGVEPLMILGEMPGPYRVEEYAGRTRGVATHTCPMAPYRGVSRPVITFALERLMDTAAARLGMEPVALRRLNLVDSFPHTTPTGVELDPASYVATLDRAEAEADVAGFRRRQAAARAEGRYLGIGFSVFNERTGYGTPAFGQRAMEVTPGYETVAATMDPSGFVELRIGASPHGQGLATALAQLAADALGVEPAAVTVVHGDTDRTPYGWGTFASRSLVISGGATHMAAGRLRQRILEVAGGLLEAAAEDLVLADGRVTVAGTDRSVELREVARTAYHRSHTLAPGLEPGLSASATYDPAGTFSNACHVAEVEVDAETGIVRLQRFVVVEDAGRLINPLIVDGQIMGGVAQGIANALLEEVVYDGTGNPLTATLADYLVPTAAEIPALEIHHLVTESEASLTRAKGLGEGGTIGAPAAVVNAVNDAVAPFGVTIDEIPASPRRLRARLRAAEREEAQE